MKGKFNGMYCPSIILPKSFMLRSPLNLKGPSLTIVTADLFRTVELNVDYFFNCIVDDSKAKIFWK